MASKTKRHKALKRIYHNLFGHGTWGRPSSDVCDEIIKKLAANVNGGGSIEGKIANLILWCDKHQPALLGVPDYKKSEKICLRQNVKTNDGPKVSVKEAFYKSWEWRTLRMEALKEFGARCQCCGATRDDIDISGAPVRIVVDHIQPISKFWSLRLDRANLQILCDECNQGKGAWDQTDWRAS